MKFKNKITGTILSTENELVVDQLQKNSHYTALEVQPKDVELGSGSDFGKMKKDELLTYAAQNGITVDASDTKDKLVAAITEGLAAKIAAKVNP